jgi:hypothetical protein
MGWPLSPGRRLEPPGGRTDIHSSKSNLVSSLSTGVLVPEAPLAGKYYPVLNPLTLSLDILPISLALSPECR